MIIYTGFAFLTEKHSWRREEGVTKIFTRVLIAICKVDYAYTKCIRLIAAFSPLMLYSKQYVWKKTISQRTNSIKFLVFTMVRLPGTVCFNAVHNELSRTYSAQSNSQNEIFFAIFIKRKRYAFPKNNRNDSGCYVLFFYHSTGRSRVTQRKYATAVFCWII